MKIIQWFTSSFLIVSIVFIQLSVGICVPLYDVSKITPVIPESPRYENNSEQESEARKPMSVTEAIKSDFTTGLKYFIKIVLSVPCALIDGGMLLSHISFGTAKPRFLSMLWVGSEVQDEKTQKMQKRDLADACVEDLGVGAKYFIKIVGVVPCLLLDIIMLGGNYVFGAPRTYSFAKLWKW